MAPLVPWRRVPDEWLEDESTLETLVERWERKHQENAQRAEQKGRQEGEAALLRRQLERRFGPRPDWAADRIAAADTAALEEWSLRVLDAGSLEDVLA